MKQVIILLTISIFLIGLTSCGIKLSEANILKEWTIDKYRITYSRKIGPTGPHYFQYEVYKNDKYLSCAAYLIDSDSCLLRFREENDYYVDFNLCDFTKKLLRPDKQKIDSKAIDSITIRLYDSMRLVPSGKSYPAAYYDTVVIKNFDPTLTKKLNEKEIKVFINKWNHSKTNGLDRLGGSYHYLLIVYSGSSKREIKTLNNYLTENESWSYETAEDDFFDKLWKNRE